MAPCPLNHEIGAGNQFFDALEADRNGEPKSFVNYQNQTFSSFALSGSRQDAAAESSLNQLDGPLPYGEKLDICNEESLNRLNWTLMNMVWSPFQKYPSGKGLSKEYVRSLKKRILFKPHNVFDPAEVVAKMRHLRECCRRTRDRFPTVNAYWRQASVILEEIDFESLDHELYNFLYTTKPKDRLLTAVVMYFEDLNSGSWATGLDLGRSYRNQKSKNLSLIHYLGDGYSWFSTDWAVNELLHATRSCPTPQAFNPVSNWGYCVMLCKLRRSVGLSAGLQAGLYKLFFEKGSDFLSEALGDTLELIGGLAVMYGRAKLFSLLVQNCLYLATVGGVALDDPRQELRDPCDLPRVFCDEEHGRGSTSSIEQFDADLNDWAGGLDACIMPQGWKRQCKISASSGATEISWLSYSHPDPYVAYCMRTNMLFRSLSKYWSLQKDAPRENRNYRGKRQAGLALRIYPALNKFFRGTKCEEIVRKYSPNNNAILLVEEYESHAAKELQHKRSKEDEREESK
ncbi:hypothetical protein Pmar_PMAR029310 [Perkinsus marinus ATCC 50983]|uniref:Uncharacterized protein n=2 Tax=Perkinsus marinus (strain ATCC 50983 / TXsc) TaxID=423536 RepID=C5KMT6_PERM5|nr:hypothetical protein Pmar_PMAR029310 [Perkinsus marinus ATCC 50983]EER14244.1 hypothetical protein Pmar_PMAR029310 [Perkinsus marinus ATCC 50983]|eukprot:XP_002782449.1 hypothetical protein Pmar_PMAR029310 [Perkinsus marinus ATCC 50983]